LGYLAIALTFALFGDALEARGEGLLEGSQVGQTRILLQLCADGVNKNVLK
jgi:hypothetical protein